MQRKNEKNTAAMLYLFSALIWLVLAVVNFSNGRLVYGGLYVILVALCLFLANKKTNKEKR